MTTDGVNNEASPLPSTREPLPGAADVEVTSEPATTGGYRGAASGSSDLYRRDGVLVARRIDQRLELGELTLVLSEWAALRASEQGGVHIVAGRRDEGGWEVLHLSRTADATHIVAHALTATGHTLEHAALPPVATLLGTHRLPCAHCEARVELPAAFLGGPLTCAACGESATYDGPDTGSVVDPSERLVDRRSNASLWTWVLAFAVTNFASSMAWEINSRIESWLAVLSSVLLLGVVVASNEDPLQTSLRTAPLGVSSDRVARGVLAVLAGIGVGVGTTLLGPVASLALSGLLAAFVMRRVGLHTDLVVGRGEVVSPKRRRKIARVELRPRWVFRERGRQVREMRVELVEEESAARYEIGSSADAAAMRRKARSSALALRGGRPVLGTWSALEDHAYADGWAAASELASTSVSSDDGERSTAREVAPTTSDDAAERDAEEEDLGDRTTRAQRGR